MPLKILLIVLALFLGGREAAAQAVDLVEGINNQLPKLLAGARSDVDAQHTPQIKAPRVVETANEVQVTVTVPLVGDENHYIRRLALIDEESLVKVKYIATFTPKVRPAQVTATIKMAQTSRLRAIAECSVHGKWMCLSETIHVGIGGCGVGQEPSRKIVGEVLRVRFQEEAQRMKATLLFRHPMVSGYLITPDGRITKNYEPFYLQTARLLHNGQLLAEFELGPGLSENPQISVLLPSLGSDPLEVETVNTEGQKFSLRARMPQ